MVSKSQIQQYLEDISPIVKNVHIVYKTPGVLDVEIKLKWYSWILFGFLHYSIKQEALMTLREYCPSGILFNVTVK